MPDVKVQFPVDAADNLLAAMIPGMGAAGGTPAPDKTAPPAAVPRIPMRSAPAPMAPPVSPTPALSGPLPSLRPLTPGAPAQPSMPPLPANTVMRGNTAVPAPGFKQSPEGDAIPKTFGDKLGGVLGKIGGYALSALTPNVAAMIPSTPLGRIVQQNREIRQNEVQNRIEGEKATADEARARTQALETGDVKEQTYRSLIEQGKSPDEALEIVEGAGKAPEKEGTPQARTYDDLIRQGKTPEEALAITQSAGKPDKTTGTKEQIQSQLNAELSKPTPDQTVVRGLQDKLRAIDPLAEDRFRDAEDRAAKAEDVRGDARTDRVYNSSTSRLDKIRTPLSALGTRLQNLSSTINQETPQADALVAPELLSIMAGGQGSGLRMNDAEINRIVGGKDNWQKLQSKIQAWQTDPSKPFEITKEQRGQLRTLYSAVRDRVVEEQRILDEASDKLDNSDDPKDMRRIVTDVNKKLDALTKERTASGGPDSGTKTYNGFEYTKGEDGQWHKGKAVKAQ